MPNMTNDIVRKAQTSEPGNPGEFGTHNRPDADTKLVDPAAPVQVTLIDGTTMDIPGYAAKGFRGISAEGYLVVTDINLPPKEGEPEHTYGLTPCCQASSKGLYDEVDDYGYVGCRKCYQEVDPALGGQMAVAVAVAPDQSGDGS